MKTFSMQRNTVAVPLLKATETTEQIQIPSSTAIMGTLLLLPITDAVASFLHPFPDKRMASGVLLRYRVWQVVMIT